MKKRIVSCAAVFTAIALFWSIPLIARKTVKSSLPSYHSEEPEKTGYTLREYEGKIAVFSEEGSLPVSILDIDIRTLPISERQALAKGIYAANEEELNKRIEDYSS